MQGLVLVFDYRFASDSDSVAGFDSGFAADSGFGSAFLVDSDSASFLADSDFGSVYFFAGSGYSACLAGFGYSACLAGFGSASSLADSDSVSSPSDLVFGCSPAAFSLPGSASFPGYSVCPHFSDSRNLHLTIPSNSYSSQTEPQSHWHQAASSRANSATLSVISLQLRNK